ncbi:MAG: sulfurtransferase complex subunit TusB [Pseudohongiella sp.]|nr:sulfurtransferase complex subunit TusB [Pseudohongiella sp.]
MTILHTISRSPSSALLASCASLLASGDAVLFIEDGIYHCSDNKALSAIEALVKLYVLREDLMARGMLGKNLADAEIVGYDAFVELCCEYDKVVSWF